jgi:hypothetical protein
VRLRPLHCPFLGSSALSLSELQITVEKRTYKNERPGSYKILKSPALGIGYRKHKEQTENSDNSGELFDFTYPQFFVLIFRKSA